MEVLITGAAGFLGSALSRRLVGDGHHVRALVRPGSDASSLDGVAVERVSGDVTDPGSVARAVQGAEVVFHLAGLRRAPERSAFFRVNAEGTRTVCDTMLRAGARRMVLAGSLAAVGPSRPDRPHVETDPLAPEEWYGESKAEAERIALGTEGLETTVARPPRIVGPGDRENLVFFRLLKRGFRLEIGGGPRPLSVVDVDDVVELLVLLARRREAVGEAFFAPGPDLTTLEEIQALGAEVLGVKTRTIRLSPRRLQALAAMADGFSRLTGKHLPLNRKLARQLLAPAWTCSGEKARARLGWVPRIEARTSIARSATWYQAKGWL
jgi:nucleoside-diphosphate-sugar epimerase